MDGTLELRDMLPKELKIDVCYYVDDEGNFHFDLDEMQNEFSSFLNALEKVSEKYKK
jgi:hypothetical protein